MSKHITPVICLSIIIMDMVAGALGIEAEVSQNKVKHLRMLIFECRDPSDDAFKLGLGSLVLLSLAHTIATLFGRCICVRSKEEFEKSANKLLVVASLSLSWIIWVFAFSMLIIGTLANSKSRKSCAIAHHHFLSIGGFLCFIHGLFAVAYYVSAMAVRQEQEELQLQRVRSTHNIIIQ